MTLFILAFRVENTILKLRSDTALSWNHILACWTVRHIFSTIQLQCRIWKYLGPGVAVSFWCNDEAAAWETCIRYKRAWVWVLASLVLLASWESRRQLKSWEPCGSCARPELILWRETSFFSGSKCWGNDSLALNTDWDVQIVPLGHALPPSAKMEVWAWLDHSNFTLWKALPGDLVYWQKAR